ncbi:MBL fold metallo-hydrolase [Nonomuraea sp. NBC_01738]|uniref:MBL fold metallo-hydrolase n=1 Tax=Nonomuraea sp. NBC_01738 TaxID=2976003 RepID=UPI002E0F7460|nr:MBL fold metallo-hydrolase [Nonomuraea sp. NBC_01738]
MGPSLRLPFLETFLGATADEGPWVLHFHCFLMRGPDGHVTLVDTGIGPAGSPASSWAPVPGKLVTELAAAGVTPGEVDTIVLTHLHSDHFSGSVIDGEPVFVNARHVIQRAELDAAGEPTRRALLDPLGDTVHAVDGDAEIARNIWVRLTPGHTPGHQIVETDGFTMSGDILHHPAQLADPSIRYVYDDDSDTAARTRLDLVARMKREHRVLATAHFPEPLLQL